MTSQAHAPIGVFDSGLGGLTVLKELTEAFPEEDFVYLGDTARIPYGTKSADTIKAYTFKNIHFLKNLGVKAIVVACNSASSVLDDIKKSEDFTLPVFDVISPSAELAAKVSDKQIIGVIATRATVAQRSYVTKIKQHSLKAQVYQQCAPLLVSLVEEGWDEDPLTNLVCFRYLSPLIEAHMDTLVLGCTHYPVLRKSIERAVGPQVKIIESSLAVRADMEWAFDEGALLAKPASSPQPKASSVKILLTDHTPHSQSMVHRILNIKRDLMVDKVDI